MAAKRKRPSKEREEAEGEEGSGTSSKDLLDAATEFDSLLLTAMFAYRLSHGDKGVDKAKRSPKGVDDAEG
jgi:hypothetical protein